MLPSECYPDKGSGGRGGVSNHVSSGQTKGGMEALNLSERPQAAGENERKVGEPRERKTD